MKNPSFLKVEFFGGPWDGRIIEYGWPEFLPYHYEVAVAEDWDLRPHLYRDCEENYAYKPLPIRRYIYTRYEESGNYVFLCEKVSAPE